MINKRDLKDIILRAFSHACYPGDGLIKGSVEGAEPFYVQEAFRGKTDWHKIDAHFLDSAPRGLASALSFFSKEAFRFYLPAYLLADIDGHLEQTDVCFHLVHGFDDVSRNKKVNPQRYGETVWFDAATEKTSVFSCEEVAAIVAFLEFKKDQDSLEAGAITQALANYWYHRLSELAH